RTRSTILGGMLSVLREHEMARRSSHAHGVPRACRPGWCIGETMGEFLRKKVARSSPSATVGPWMVSILVLANSGREARHFLREVSAPGGPAGIGEDDESRDTDGPLRAALGEAVAVEADSEHEVDTVPGHQHGEEA